MNQLAVISKKIITLPGRPLFMLDSDVAALFETETRAVNQAVRRNIDRFPEDFCFELTGEEFQQVIAICDNPKRTGAKLAPVQENVVTDCDLKTDGRGGRRYLPFAFTREGCNMLSAVLSTPVAIQRSIQIMRAFSAMERGRFGAADSAPSPLLPNGWQMHELRITYGREGAQKVLKNLYGIYPDMNSREISAQEAALISVNNPNVIHRNHMIWELKERGISTGKLAQASGISRQSIHSIYTKIKHIHTKALR